MISVRIAKNYREATKEFTANYISMKKEIETINRSQEEMSTL